MVPPAMPKPPKKLLPPLTDVPDCRVGVVAADTTKPEPPLDGVRNEKVFSPTVMVYQVFLLHDDDW